MDMFLNMLDLTKRFGSVSSIALTPVLELSIFPRLNVCLFDAKSSLPNYTVLVHSPTTRGDSSTSTLAPVTGKKILSVICANKQL